MKRWWDKHKPYPFWVSCAGFFNPWCLVDDLAHTWFPMTFGWDCDKVSYSPQNLPWICRLHDSRAEKYWRRRSPEVFDYTED